MHDLVLAVSVLMAIGAMNPVVAQSAQAEQSDTQLANWRSVDAAGQRVPALVAEWESGALIALQCHADGFIARFRLVVPIEGRSVRSRYQIGGASHASAWQLNDQGDVAFASSPERFSRALLPGGDLSITFTPDEGRPQRYELNLPADTEPVRHLLEACDVPVESAYDRWPVLDLSNQNAGELAWLNRPNGQDLADAYPSRALERLQNGRATVNCGVATDGRLRDCEVVSEFPRGAGFGRATARVVERTMRVGGANGEARSFLGQERVEVPVVWNVSRQGPA